MPSRWYKYQRTLHTGQPILRLLNQLKSGAILGKEMAINHEEKMDEEEMRLLLGVYTNNIEEINYIVDSATKIQSGAIKRNEGETDVAFKKRIKTMKFSRENDELKHFHFELTPEFKRMQSMK